MFSLKAVVCRTASGSSASLNAQARSSILRLNQTAPKTAFQCRFFQDGPGQYPEASNVVRPIGQAAANSQSYGAPHFANPVPPSNGAPGSQPAFQMPSRRPTPSPKETIYVGNVTFEAKPEDLKKEFEQFGTVEEARIIYDRRGVSRGFGYVRFQTVEQSRAAIGAMHMQMYEGRRLTLNFAQSNANPATTGSSGKTAADVDPTRTLYIGNMAFEMTDLEMNDMFKDMYNLIDVRVAVDRRSGQPRGFCHAEFVDVESALAAREKLEAMTPYGRKLRLDYSNSSPGRLDRYLAERGMVRSPSGEIQIAATGEPANLHAGAPAGQAQSPEGAPSSQAPQ